MSCQHYLISLQLAFSVASQRFFTDWCDLFGYSQRSMVTCSDHENSHVVVAGFDVFSRTIRSSRRRSCQHVPCWLWTIFLNGKVSEMNCLSINYLLKFIVEGFGQTRMRSQEKWRLVWSVKYVRIFNNDWCFSQQLVFVCFVGRCIPLCAGWWRWASRKRPAEMRFSLTKAMNQLLWNLCCPACSLLFLAFICSCLSCFVQKCANCKLQRIKVFSQFRSMWSWDDKNNFIDLIDWN